MVYQGDVCSHGEVLALGDSRELWQAANVDEVGVGPVFGVHAGSGVASDEAIVGARGQALDDVQEFVDILGHPPATAILRLVEALVA